MTNGESVTYFSDANKWRAVGTQYCGLEAIVTNPATGVSKTLYITDAFDHQWVRSPGSIDIMTNAFEELFGKGTRNHNDVMGEVSWRLTGNRNEKYAFGGAGDP
jgi:hypothetical protein